MIVKIWPIKADYAGNKGKVGGKQGLKNAVKYIADKEKTIDKNPWELNPDLLDLEATDMLDGSLINTEQDFERVIRYMANEDKIVGKYISGYLCDPNSVVQDFEMTRMILGAKAQGNLAHHIVQSFPEELDISDEEVHQCGIELCEKIGKHQALICSHVHPVVDEDGEIHGACKHNHILINAFVHPSFIDPEHPDRIKYHGCEETYRQLRVWNDEIALDHGLPIILNPDEQRTYSWMESKAINKGLSWKERIRQDIETARRVTSKWEDFASYMWNKGYEIKEGKHITYTAPDKKHKARGAVLGKSYTKEGLELYWKLREEMTQRVQEELQINDSPTIPDILKQHPEYTVAIPLSKQSLEKRKYYYLSLSRTGLSQDAVGTYFNHEEVYDICNENHETVYTVSGDEIISYYMHLDSDEARNARDVEERDWYAKEQNARWKKQAEQEEVKKQYYTYPPFCSSHTYKPYRVRFYNVYGQQISTLEAMLTLAIVVLRKEDGLWLPSTVPPDKMNDICYAKTSWKIQNMLDCIQTVREEGIQTPAEIDRRLDEVGAAYNRARAALKRNQHVKEKMVDLKKAIAEYEQTKSIAEENRQMPDEPEKNEHLKRNAEILEQYKKAKAVMYAHRIQTDEEVRDFKGRWNQVESNIKEYTERFDQTREQYRKLKKLQYHAQLAQNTKYCYGPEYIAPEKEERTINQEKS